MRPISDSLAGICWCMAKYTRYNTHQNIPHFTYNLAHWVDRHGKSAHPFNTIGDIHMHFVGASGCRRAPGSFTYEYIRTTPRNPVLHFLTMPRNNFARLIWIAIVYQIAATGCSFAVSPHHSLFNNNLAITFDIYTLIRAVVILI